jgi:uncharacterized membrane protein
MKRLVHGGIALLSLGVAAYALAAYGFLPLGALLHPEMKATFQAHDGAIRLHIFASIAALALGPLQFSAGLRARRPRLHRLMGRIYLGVGVLLGGSSGLYVAQFAFGGFAPRLAFTLLALAWLFTGWSAYAAIRRGDVAAHRAWMLRNFALTFAAVMLRLYLPASMALGVPFEVAYPVVAWLCWVPNLAAVETWLRWRGMLRSGSGFQGQSDEIPLPGLR